MDLWVGGRTLRLEVTGGKSRGLRGAEGQTEADDWLRPALKGTAQRKKEEAEENERLSKRRVAALLCHSKTEDVWRHTSNDQHLT